MKSKRIKVVLVALICLVHFIGKVNVAHSQEKYNNLYELSKKSATVIIPLTEIVDSLENGDFGIKQSFIDSLYSLEKLSNIKDYKYYIDLELLIIDSSTINKRVFNIIDSTYKIINNIHIENVIFTTSYDITLISIQLKEAYKNHNVPLENGIIFEPRRRALKKAE